MPANLPPQYYELEREFNKETDLHEKLRMAQELLTIMPKHKGTDKLQAEMKAKISKLKKQIDDGIKKHGSHHADPHSHIDKEGAGQIILIGPPNSGKSSLLESLTNAKPLIADYPFSTREPLAGMMFFETVHLQLIDTPAISDDQTPPYLPNLIRQADLVVLVCDIAAPNFENCIDAVTKFLQEKNIILTSKSQSQADNPHIVHKKTIIAANKYLEDESGLAIDEIRKKHADFIIVPISILDDESLNNFKAEIFKALNIIRVYTKRVGHDPELINPIILPIGGTVEDAAISLHKDFAYKLQFAKVWGKGKFEGQRVKNNFILSDGDIIEFHI
jgi:ribosome-interacting GTPase 1